jgi:GT2 family glycosyltransferase
LNLPLKTVVIVLHYRGIDDTLACLASVLPQCHDGLDVLLVDNGSDDNIAEIATARFGTFAILRLNVNRGWAGGNNAGINWARSRGADLVCLLNNDTLVPDGVLDKLSATVRGFGPCLLHPAIDFIDPAEGAQLDPAATGAKPLVGFASLFRLNYSYGACLMIPIAVFDLIGEIDERFFLQLEEQDLYVRAQLAGIPSLCDASVRIRHAESRSFGARSTPLKTYYITRNRLLLAEKYPRRLTALLDAVRLIYWRANDLAAGRILPWLISDNPQAQAMRHGVRDYVLRRFGARRNSSSPA